MTRSAISETYMGIRQQLDDLPDRKTDPTAEAKLRQTDEELQWLHLELSGYRYALAEPPHPELGFTTSWASG